VNVAGQVRAPGRRSDAFAAALLLVAGCSKATSHEAPTPAAPLATASAASAATHTAPSASARAGSTEHSVWSGAYTSKVGAVDPPPNAKEKTWTLDPGTAAIGRGTIDLTIGERGETRGETKGALGDMTISGAYDGHELRANLVPTNPKADGAMTGFMVLRTDGTALKGTLRASSRDARIVREAGVELAKK
jgi:hypothetical protein